MKSILICLLLGLVFSYNGEGAAAYAKKYCNKYNPNYHNYKKIDGTDESANFASQCISVGGGLDLTGCEGLDDKGMIKKISDLKKCIISKGWKITNKISKGYLMFLKAVFLPMIVTEVPKRDIIFSSHDFDRCDSRIGFNYVDIYAPS